MVKWIFRKVDGGQDYIVIPCIVFFELLYLIEKKKIGIHFDSFIALISQSKNYRVEPLCLPIIKKSGEIPEAKFLILLIGLLLLLLYTWVFL